MKRTVLLVIILLIIASLLLFYAISINPTKKQTSIPNPSKIIPTIPTKSPAETSLIITPELKTVKENEVFNLNIQIDTGTNQITGVQLEIAYDPDILTDVKIDKGTFFPNPNILLNNIDNETGRISYALVIPPATSPLSGTGTVAIISAMKSSKSNILSESAVSILPKSLVSQIGTEGSVLNTTRNALLVFSSSSSANISLPPVNNPSNMKVQ